MILVKLLHAFEHNTSIWSDKKVKRGEKLPANRVNTIGLAVPGCVKSYRKDKINVRHYLKIVTVDSDGKPIRPGSYAFNKLDEDEQKHTKFFYENNLDPSSSKVCIPKKSYAVNPFEDMKRRQLKRTHDGERVVSTASSQTSKDSDDHPTDEALLIETQDEEQVDAGPSVSTSVQDDNMFESQHDTAVNVSLEENVEESAQQKVNMTAIMASVKEAMKSKMTPECVELMVAEISKRVTENVIEHIDNKDSPANVQNESDIWIETDTNTVCRLCMIHANSKDRPKILHGHF